MQTVKLEIKRKRVLILSPSWQYCEQGCRPTEIEEVIYYDKIFKSKKQAKKLLKKALKQYKKDRKRGTLNREPEIQYYWETVYKDKNMVGDDVKKKEIMSVCRSFLPDNEYPL